MNDVLPSYEAANTRDYWSIIARYISSADLCSAALVCKQWAAIFTRQLWGNPASHFGVENDVVYVALVRFRRTIRWARLSTRELTHTLHLPPAHAEIYDGPHAEWLRDILEYLPRLQSLIVYGLPFFDHGALITLRRPSNPRLSSLSDSLRRLTYDFPQFWLRYLDASACSNATYSGLAEALQHFPALLYLDLSRTKSAKGADVLSVLKHCHSLRILKLRGLGLKDAEIEALATAVKTRLKSLDVRNNQLTDASARILLDNCFSLRKPWPPRRPDGGPLSASSETVDSPASPSSPAMRHPFVFDQYANEDLDRVLRAKLVGEFAGNAFINDAYADGITHLYISDNNITVEGVSGLLHSKRLHVLDAGTVARGLTRKPRPPSLLSFEEEGDHEEFAMPGAEKLSPIIKKFAAGRMTYLRINHAVVTEETATADLAVGRVEMEGDLGIYAPSSAQELDGFNEVHEAPTDGAAVHEMSAGNQVPPVELPATAESQVFELPGDFPSKPAVVVDPPPPSTPQPPPEPQPQPDDDDAVATEEQLLHGTEKIKLSEAEPLPAPSPLSDDGSSAPEPLATLQTHPTLNHRRRASSLAVDDRRARLDFRQSNEHHLHPGMLPNLSTLVLTDVPREVENPAIVKRLTQFIADCAEETHLARLAARGAYALPPGRDRQLAEREFARGVFGLRRVVLEMEPVGVVKKRKVGAWRQYPSKSSTEDPDSEAFWAAAERDFSFFGDEECGVPSLEPGGRSLPPLMAGMSSEKVVILPEAAAGPVPVLVQHEARRRIDVCAELTRFRKERRAAYQAALLARGGGGGEEEGPEVEGYWEGEIQVVRPPPRTVEGEVGGGGEVDCYGNYFEKGYNYR